MSYILNALRKSDQERRATEPPPLETSILEGTTSRKARMPWLIIALVCINGITLGYFIWFHQQSPENPLNPPSTEAARIIPDQNLDNKKNNPGADLKPVEKPQTQLIEKPGNIAVRLPAIEHSIAELVDLPQNNSNKKKQPDKIEQEASKVPQEIVKVPDSQLSTDSDSPIQSPVKKLSKPSNSIKHAQAQKSVSTDKSSQDDKQNQPPFLRKMPNEFRRQVPKLNINVFVYDKDPAERFVIIDMTKYTTGQTVAEQMQLEEILPDGLLLSYKGKRFRISRP